MKRTAVQATFIVVALTLGACGSDVVQTSTADQSQNQGIAEGEPNGGDSAGESANDLLTRLWIKPDLVDCVGEMEQKCMQVAETEDGEYLWFYDQIAGFEFVEGTTYVIDVRIDEIADPPADGGSLAYTLVEVIQERE